MSQFNLAHIYTEMFASEREIEQRKPCVHFRQENGECPYPPITGVSPYPPCDKACVVRAGAKRA